MLALDFLWLFSSLIPVWLIVVEGQVCYLILYCIVHFTSFCVYVHPGADPAGVMGVKRPPLPESLGKPKKWCSGIKMP